MRKRIMLLAIAVALAALGDVLMTYTSYSPAYAFVGAGFSLLLAVFFREGKSTPIDVRQATASEFDLPTRY